MVFSKYVFLSAGVYGLLTLLPLYFLTPPPDAASAYYGFLGVTIAWQLAFLIISRDVPRFRPLIPAAWVEKFGWTILVLILTARGQAPAVLLGFALVDAVWGALFIAAYSKTANAFKR